jgi:hypothetical protein
MIFRDRTEERNLMLIGMAFLAVANLSRWFLHPTAGFGQDSIDGTYGVLIGVSIGCLLLSLWLRRRRCSGEGRWAILETSADGGR